MSIGKLNSENSPYTLPLGPTTIKVNEFSINTLKDVSGNQTNNKKQAVDLESSATPPMLTAQRHVSHTDHIVGFSVTFG